MEIRPVDTHDLNLLMRNDQGAGQIEAFHGSPYQIDSFRPFMAGCSTGAHRHIQGVFFATRQEVARTYGENLHTVSLLIERSVKMDLKTFHTMDEKTQENLSSSLRASGIQAIIIPSRDYSLNGDPAYLEICVLDPGCVTIISCENIST